MLRNKKTFSTFIKLLLPFAYCLLPIFSFAQSTTYSPDEKKKESPVTDVKDNRKVLVIPFEPRLYMSEIDRNVNKETKMNFNQIRAAFRSGLDFSIVAEFKKKYSVVSLMNDTLQSKKDQFYIYESIGYKYDLVPTEDNKTQKDNTDNKPKIQNGQLTVMTNDQKKFMNAKITNPNLLETLHKKYGTELFVFITQLDLKNNVDNTGKASMENYDRIASVHYSIYDLKGNLLNAGLASKNFPAGTNNPNKIVNSYFSGIAQTILENYIAATTPKTDKTKGSLQWSPPAKTGN